MFRLMLCSKPCASLGDAAAPGTSRAPVPARATHAAEDNAMSDFFEQARRIEWIRTEIDRDELKALYERSDWKGLKQSLLHLGLVALSGWFTWYAAHHLAWPFVAVGFFFHGMFLGFCTVGAAGHELSHRTPFKSRVLNRVFTWIFAFLGWTNQVWFRTSHTKHHQFTLHRPWDLEVVLPRRAPTFWGWVRAFTVDPLTLYNVLRDHVRRALGKVDGEWANRIFPPDQPDERRRLANASRVLLLGHLALAVLFIAIGEWVLIPLFALPPFYGGWLTGMCGATQHSGMQSQTPDFRRSCRTVRLNIFTSFLYWQMNYHIEHHMYPAVPFYNLRKLHERIMADGCPPPNRGLLDALREIYRTQRYQDEHPDTAFDSFSRGSDPRYGPQYAEPVEEAALATKS
jgi:fatty acid desaturase